MQVLVYLGLATLEKLGLATPDFHACAPRGRPSSCALILIWSIVQAVWARPVGFPRIFASLEFPFL